MNTILTVCFWYLRGPRVGLSATRQLDKGSRRLEGLASAQVQFYIINDRIWLPRTVAASLAVCHDGQRSAKRYSLVISSNGLEHRMWNTLPRYLKSLKIYKSLNMFINLHFEFK